MQPFPGCNQEGKLVRHPENGCNPAYDRAGFGNIFISFGTTALLWLISLRVSDYRAGTNVSHADRPSLALQTQLTTAQCSCVQEVGVDTFQRSGVWNGTSHPQRRDSL